MSRISAIGISEELVKEIIEALEHIRGWGSVEIIMQDHNVVQITERNIKKTNRLQIKSIMNNQNGHVENLVMAGDE